MSLRPVDIKKRAYRERVLNLVSEYSRVFIVKADNVGSNQLHQIRRSLRGKAVLLMGKNVCLLFSFLSCLCCFLRPCHA